MSFKCFCVLFSCTGLGNTNNKFCVFLCLSSGIHSNSWIRWMQKSADDFEFSAERLSENAKCIKIIVFAELLTAISSIYVQSLQQIVNKNIKTHYIPKKNATLTPNSCDFYDLLTFVAKFCGQNLRTFPQIFLDWKAKSADFYTFRMYGWGSRVLMRKNNVMFLRHI